MYHAEHGARVFDTPESLKEAGDGWVDTPAKLKEAEKPSETPVKRGPGRPRKSEQ